MPKAAFCGLPHSESEVYYVKSSAIGRQPAGTAVLHAQTPHIGIATYRQADACRSPGHVDRSANLCGLGRYLTFACAWISASDRARL